MADRPAAGAAAPIDPAHRQVLRVLCARLPVDEIHWALTGSLGARLQGVDLTVHDVDVQTSLAHTARVADLLADYVVTPPRPWESERVRSVFATLRIAEVEVELMGGMAKRSDPAQPWGPPVDPVDHRVLAEVDGLTVPVLSLAYEARAYEEMGRHERAALLRSAARSRA